MATDFNSFHSAMPTSFRLVLSNVSIEELLLCLISIVLPYSVAVPGNANSNRTQINIFITKYSFIKF